MAVLDPALIPILLRERILSPSRWGPAALEAVGVMAPTPAPKKILPSDWVGWEGILLYLLDGDARNTDNAMNTED